MKTTKRRFGAFALSLCLLLGVTAPASSAVTMLGEQSEQSETPAVADQGISQSANTPTKAPAAEAPSSLDASAPKEPAALLDAGTRTVLHSGTCGDDITWALYDDGELRISGAGEMPYYNWNATPWYPYREDITSARVDEGITRLANTVFSQCTGITRIALPASLTEIPSDTITNLWNLTELTVAAGNPYYTVVNNVLFTKDMTTLVANVPSRVGNTDYVIPDGVTTIESNAFNNSQLTSITLPASVTSLGERSFTGYRLASVTVDPANSNFCDVDGVLFSKDMTRLILSPAKALLGKPGTYRVPDMVRSFDNYAFDDNDELTGIILPEGVTELSEFLFNSCDSLTHVTLPGTVTTIHNHAFRNCRGLLSLTLPAGVRNISRGVVGNCPLFSDVYYEGASIDAINIHEDDNDTLRNARWHCGCTIPIVLASAQGGSLSVRYGYTGKGDVFSVTATPAAGYMLDHLSVDHGTANGNEITVDSEGDFDAVTVTPVFKAVRPGKTITAGGACPGGGSWTLYDDGELYLDGSGAILTNNNQDVSRIPWTSVRSQIHSLTIAEGVTSIGARALQRLELDQPVFLHAGLVQMDEWMGFLTTPAFEVDPANPSYCAVDGVLFSKDMTRLIRYPATKDGTEYAVPDGVTALGSMAFEHSRKLTHVSLPASLTQGDGISLMNMVAMQSVTVDDGNPAFSAVNGVLFNKDRSILVYYPINKPDATYQIPGTVREIGIDAFASNRNLLTMTIPDNVTKIGQEAFNSSQSMVSIDFGNGVTQIDRHAINYSYKLSWVAFGENLASIEQNALQVCPALKDVYYIGSDKADIAIDASNTDLLNATWHYGSAAPIDPWPGETPIASGSCGEYAVWGLFDGGELRIGGRGAMEDYNGTATVPWLQYNNQITSITIEEGITAISRYAFWGCNYASQISLPDSLERIGECAFCWTASSEITIPAGVTVIGEGAFGACQNLTQIHVAAENQNFVAVDNVLFDSDMTILYAYPAGKEDTAYTVPSGVTVIGAFAFYKAVALKQIFLPAGLVELKPYAFQHCEGLANISLPASLTAIGDTTFRYCYSLASIDVAKNNPRFTSVDGVLFTKDMSTLFCYPNSRAARYTVPAGVIRIGKEAFSGCIDISTVILPEGVTTVDIGAFYWCQGLTAVALPASLTNVRTQAFQDCSALADVYYAGSQEDRAGINIETINEPLQEAIWHYDLNIPIALLPCEHGTIQVSSPLAAPNDTFTVSVTPEAGYTLDHLTVDHGTVQGNQVTVDAGGGFDTITVGAVFRLARPGVAIAASGAFGSLVWVFYEDGQLRISGTGAMPNCDWNDQPWVDQREQIKSIYLEPGITTIGGRVFLNCINLTQVTIPEGVTLIGNNSFGSCVKLTNITLPSTLQEIDYWAFYRCGLSQLTLPNSLTTLGIGALAGLSNLSSFTVASDHPAYKTVDGALYSKDGTTLVSYPAGRSGTVYALPDGVTAIQGGALGGSKITHFDIPDGFTAVTGYMFYNALSLRSVSIPASVTSIEYYAFESCNALTDIYFAGTEVQWNAISINSSGNAPFLNATVHYGWDDVIPLQSGSCGEDLSWSLYSNGTLILSGNGPMDDYSAAGAPWYDYHNEITTVTVGDGVTSIGQNAFTGCNQITDITLPGSRTMLAGTGAPDTAMVHSVEELSALTVEAIAAQTYHGTAITPAITLKDGSTALVKDTDYTVEYANNVNAGTATVTITVTQAAGETENSATHAKYTGSKIVTFSIEKAPLTVTAKAQSITYGGSITQGVGQVTATGLQGKDVLGGVTLTADAENVPGGTITPSAAIVKNGETDVTANYEILYETGTLTIAKATYAAPTAPVAVEVTNTSVALAAIPGAEYSLDGETWQSETLFSGLTHHTAYTFYARMKADSNHNASPTSAGTAVTTLQTALTGATVTVSGSYTYNAASQTPTAENVTVKLGGVTVDPEEYTISATGNVDVGIATVTVTAKADGHYSGGAQGSFSIGKAALTVTAKAQSITYGESITQGAGQVVTEGLQGSDALDSVTLTPSTANVPGGIITPSDATVKNGEVDVTANYEISYATGALTIAKAIPVAPEAPMADAVENTAITLVSVPNAQYSIDGETWQDDPAFPDLEPFTTYTFYLRLKESNNYLTSPASAGVRIKTSQIPLTPAVVTIAGTYTYQAADITPAAEAITVRLNGEVIDPAEYELSFSGNRNAGTATVTVTATEESHYTGTARGTFAIEKVALSVTAKAQNITYGQSIATGISQVTATGLQGSDTLDGVTLTPSTANVPGGTITPSDAAVKNGETDVTVNYEISYEAGTLTIGKATYAAPDAPIAAEITDSSVTLTAIPGAEYSLDGETWQDAVVFSGLTPHTVYTFYARIKADSNHNASPASEGPTVTTLKTSLNAATVTVSGSYTYNAAAQVPTAENVTVKLGDKTVDPEEYTISATSNVNAGTATLTVTAKADGHYSGSAQTDFSIAPAVLTVGTVTAADRAYEPGNSTVAITAMKLVGVLPADAQAVYVDLSTLVGQLSGADAGAYTAVTLPTLSLAGEQSKNYTLTQPTGPVSVSVTVSPKTVQDLTVTLDIDTALYTGEAIVPTPHIQSEGVTLTERDYDVTYADNTEAGTATVTVTLKGNYSGTATARFEITYSAWKIQEDGMLTVDMGDIPETWMFYAVGYSNDYEMLWIKLVTNETGPIDTTTADKVVFFLLDDDLLPQMGKETVK